VVEQESAVFGSQAVQVAPAAPQAAAVRAWQTPAAQHPLEHDVASHTVAGSIRQVAEQPSPETVFPSSHSSIGLRRRASPQIAGAPSISDRFTSWPDSMVTTCCSLPTITLPARPSM
jgi:hypothetical protein